MQMEFKKIFEDCALIMAIILVDEEEGIKEC